MVGGIVDSAGSSSGVPLNNWISLGSANNDGIRTEWWVSKLAVSITTLTIDLTETNDIIAVALEYNGANGISNPVFQAVQANQNTITSQNILETVATVADSAAELMLGLFSALGDTFNATPPTPSGAPQTVRSTNSLSIPPSLSYQVIEQGAEATVGSFTSGGENVRLAVGSLNVTAESASQLATAGNVAGSTIGCLYIVISGGLVLNTQPGFNDQPDSSLVAGEYALGLQMAKISGNAALGMCRMEVFSGYFQNGQNAAGPWISPVDGYQYSIDELIFIWGIASTANPQSNWLTGPSALWYCNWNVDQETGDVTCQEWYRNDSQSGTSNDGTLQVFVVAQRQQQTLTVAATPSWTQLNPSAIVQDTAYRQDLLQEMNDDAKFAVIGQECIFMGVFANGGTVPRPVSPADDYEYAYSETKFVFSWLFTTETDGGQQSVTTPPWTPYYNLATLDAAINASTGVVTCAVGWGGNAGEGYTRLTSYGMIAVFAFCQRSRSGAPAAVANQFAEIDNELFFPGNDLPAGIGDQLINNINEAALTPEYFGPTLYEFGATIPLPTSPIDGYVYQASECTCIWEWGEMVAYPSFPPGSGANQRTALFQAAVVPATGYAGKVVNAVTTGPPETYESVVWRLVPGGPYTAYFAPGSGGGGGSGTVAAVMVLVIAARSSQQSELTAGSNTPPSDSGSTVADQIAAGPITVNGT